MDNLEFVIIFSEGIWQKPFSVDGALVSPKSIDFLQGDNFFPQYCNQNVCLRSTDLNLTVRVVRVVMAAMELYARSFSIFPVSKRMLINKV